MTLPPDLQVLARGWMHGNTIALRGEAHALVDTGYHTGVHAVRALCERHFDGALPTTLALTHVHSDHAGGVASLVASTGAEVLAHPDAAALTDPWDPHALWLEGTGQELPRFRVTGALEPGTCQLAGRRWEVLHTPGHATGGVSLFRPEDGVLISGDALWEDGFGLLNPWVDGPGVFDDTERALAALGPLPAVVVIPGHGAPFTDLSGALARARRRLERMRADPAGHRRKALTDLVGFAAMAHRGAVDLRALLRAAMAAYPPLPGDPGGREEALAQSVLDRLSRPSR
jgi:glyoxylase-like metal-dependent hydrolase (beta-lactamase superfamily II)